MYVCICNGISDAKLLEAAREGGASVDEIYANLGAQPQCRKCVPHVERVLGLEPASGLSNEARDRRRAQKGFVGSAPAPCGCAARDSS